MDTDMAALAAEAGRAIVQAMVSDGWAAARPRLAALVRRAGGANVAAIDADRDALDNGRLTSDTVTGRWEARMEALLERHPELAPDVRVLLEDLRRAGSPTPTRQSIRNVAGPAFQAGGNIHHSGNTSTDNSKRSYGGILAVVAVIAVLAIVGVGVVTTVIVPAIGGVGGSAITADTTCGEYLQASYAEREQAVQRIAVEIEVSGAGSPFLMLNVDDQCGNQLNTSVGEVIGRQRY